MKEIMHRNAVVKCFMDLSFGMRQIDAKIPQPHYRNHTTATSTLYLCQWFNTC